MITLYIVTLFNFYAEYIMWNANLDESQVGIKIARRNINFIYVDDTTLMAEREENLKNLLMRVKKESEIDGLKLNIQKTKIMASGPITSWKTEGKKVEAVTSFIFLCSKITADGDCSHEIKRCLLLGRKTMTNLDSMLKSRDITLPTKIHIVKAMVCPVVMYGCEIWIIKKAEHHRIDAFKLRCWRRLLSPSDRKEIKPVNPKRNQSWIFIGGTVAEAPILWPLDVKCWLIEKDQHHAGKHWRQKANGDERGWDG